MKNHLGHLLEFFPEDIYICNIILYIIYYIIIDCFFK